MKFCHPPKYPFMKRIASPQGSDGIPFCPRFTKRSILITNACCYQNTARISAGLANPGEAAHRSPSVLSLCITPHLSANALSFRAEAPGKTLPPGPGHCSSPWAPDWRHITDKHTLWLSVFSLENISVKTSTDLWKVLE